MWRKLVGVEIAGLPIPLNMIKWPILHASREVGFVTSAVYSPRLEKNIGYANVPTGLSELGTALAVVVEGRDERPATVVRKPFVDPEKEIPKS